MATQTIVEPNIYIIRRDTGEFLRYYCRMRWGDRVLKTSVINLHDARVWVRRLSREKELARKAENKAKSKPIETHKLAGWGFR